MVGRMGGCWLSENRPRILNASYRQGLAILQRLAPAGRAHLSRAYHTIP
jgi:hypothetical protein